MSENYSTEEFLNPEDSHYSSSIKCFDGVVKDRKGVVFHDTKVVIHDCYGSVRIHPDTNYTEDEYVKKLRLLADELNKFADHLEKDAE
jgi:hypothetical protein